MPFLLTLYRREIMRKSNNRLRVGYLEQVRACISHEKHGNAEVIRNGIGFLIYSAWLQVLFLVTKQFVRPPEAGTLHVPQLRRKSEM